MSLVFVALIKTPVYTVKIQENTSDRLGNYQMGEKTYSSRSGKSRNFICSPAGKIDILKKSLGKLK